MAPPVKADRALSILILRVLHQTQDAVADIVCCRKNTVGNVETWFGKELTYPQAKAFVDDQAIKRLADRDFGYYGLVNEDLDRARQIAGDDILRHFRDDHLLASGGVERPNPIQQQATMEKIESHWGKVLAILNDLHGIGVFAPDAREVRL